MKKIYIIILFIAILLFTSCSSQGGNKSIVFNDKYYTLESEDSNSEIYRSSLDNSTIEIIVSDSSYNEFQMKISDEEYYLIKKNSNSVSVTYPNGNKSTVYENSISASINMSLDFDETDRLHEIYNIFNGDTNKKEGSMNILLVPLLIIGGILNITNPKLSFYLSKGWRFKNAEPSELYLGLTKLSGIVLIIAAIIVFISNL